MAAYRFCRTDDIPLLVEAYNTCYAVHFPHEPPLTVERFKAAVHDLDVWCSSCMVASEGDRPVGVLLAAKRPYGTLIYRLGIAAGHQRRGHGRHLLNSLSQKLAILGPPSLLAEIPATWETTRRFFAACDYTAGSTYSDFAMEDAPGTDAQSGMVTPVTLDDLRASGALTPAAGCSWWRSEKTLENRKEELQGLAVASDLRMEAWLLYATDTRDESREVVALGRAPGQQAASLLAILVRQLAGPEGVRVTLPRLSADEIYPTEVAGWGFRQAGEYVRYAATAAPA